jgi:hypothetical protein
MPGIIEESPVPGVAKNHRARKGIVGTRTATRGFIDGNASRTMTRGFVDGLGDAKNRQCMRHQEPSVGRTSRTVTRDVLAGS